MTISDHSDIEGGGCDWNTFIFHKETNILAQKMTDYLGVQIFPQITMLRARGPIQKNLFDCGLYTLAAIDFVVKAWK